MPDLRPGNSAIVMGLGRFGGGVGAAKYLLQRGMNVTVTDLGHPEDLEDSITRLRKVSSPGKLDLRLGTHDGLSFDAADLVVASPAVPSPWKNRYLTTAREAGVPVCTEIQLFLDRIDHGKIIAVTGSSGKSSTCAMIHHALTRSGITSMLGGNLGGSLLGRSDAELDAVDAVVLELSSFMLHWMGESNDSFQPGTAVLTTLSANHVDWHETEAHYVASKRFLLESANVKSLVLPIAPGAVDESLVRMLDPDGTLHGRADTSWESKEHLEALLSEIRLGIPGTHQRDNAATALRTIASHLETDPQKRRLKALELAATLESFPGLPHRLKPLQGFEGIQVIDDSKSTTPEATLKAVEAFDAPGSIHLIAGGFDKQNDLSALDRLGDVLAGLYAIGATAGMLSSGRNAMQCGTIEEAVRRADASMQPGDILLLSPGCASWDQFDNYEQRGRAFESAARTLLSTGRESSS